MPACFWGHERLSLEKDDPLRAQMKDMAMDTGRHGLRAQGVVDCPWLYDALAKTGH